MSLVTELDYDFLESYVSMALLHAPFVPFIVIFCHIIETGDKNDLDLLESVTKTLQFAMERATSSAVRKEYHLFKALYDAACSYIEARSSKADFGFCMLANTSSSTSALRPTYQQPASLTSVSTLDSSQTDAGVTLDGTAEWIPHSFETPVEAEVDHYGAQLGNWLHMSNQMTKAKVSPRSSPKSL
ncbi:hypothetical protein ACHAPU_011434 [Fusarium lateritium]